jgi:hypothetical protein
MGIIYDIVQQAYPCERSRLLIIYIIWNSFQRVSVVQIDVFLGIEIVCLAILLFVFTRQNS